MDLEEQLITISKEEVLARGWPWIDPVHITGAVHEKEAVWIVRTNAQGMGRSANILIRKSDLAIVHAGYLSR